MSGNGRGEAPKVRFGIDPELTDWVLVVQGPTLLIGKSSAPAAALQAEMADGQTPMTTLTPVYAIMAHILMTDRGMGNIVPGLVQMPFRLEQYANLGRHARLPLQVTLTAFAFLGTLDPASKAHVVKTLVDYEHGLQASQAGLVLPTR